MSSKFKSTPLFRAFTALILGLALLATSANVSAQSKESVERASELNEQGFEKFKNGEFDAAARKFRAAHETLPRAEFRKNEAVAWFKAEKCTQAVAAAQSFLSQRSGSKKDRSQARSIVANCKVQLAREALDAGSVKVAVTLLQEAEALEPDDYTRDQISSVWVEIARNQRVAQESREQGELSNEAAERARAEEARSGESDAKSSEEADVDLARAELEGADQETEPPILGWTLVGTGAAILVGTVIYHVLMMSAEDEFVSISENGGDRARYDELKGQIDTGRWLIPTLYGLGGALTGVGVWLVVDHPESTAQTKSSTVSEVGVHVFFRF